MNWLGIAGLIVGGGGLGWLLKAFFIPAEKRKIHALAKISEADAAEKVSEIALKLLEPARQEIDRLNTRLATADTRLATAEDLVQKLTASLRSAQAEVSDLRNDIQRMTKDHTAAIEEIQRLQAKDEES